MAPADTPIRRSVRKRKPLLVKANEQYVLDFGQKNIEPTRCPTCRMIYVVGEEQDEKQHAKYHAGFDEGVKWPAKLERPRKYFDDGSRVVAITSQDPKPVLEAIDKLLRVSDGEMSTGSDVSKLLCRPDSSFLVYITPDHHVVGYICVEKINEAYNLIDFDSSRLESEPVRADCGVLYLWVHPTYRHQRESQCVTPPRLPYLSSTRTYFTKDLSKFTSQLNHEEELNAQIKPKDLKLL